MAVLKDLADPAVAKDLAGAAVLVEAERADLQAAAVVDLAAVEAIAPNDLDGQTDFS